MRFNALFIAYYILNNAIYDEEGMKNEGVTLPKIVGINKQILYKFSNLLATGIYINSFISTNTCINRQKRYQCRNKLEAVRRVLLVTSMAYDWSTYFYMYTNIDFAIN